MERIAKGALDVRVEDPNWKTISNAKVTATRREKDTQSKPIVLKLSKETQSYHATDIVPGQYLLQADAPHLEGDERQVVIHDGANSERFVLGRKGMPVYYRGTVRVPFDPDPARLAVALAPAIPDDEIEKLRALIRELGLTEQEDIPQEVRQEGVAIYTHSENDDAMDGTIAKLRAHTAVAAAGLVRHQRFLGPSHDHPFSRL
ncbi:hypothetical protein ACEWPL_015595 [Roseovarius sp. S1116L3]|uniref:hypothetical protein n=1 Tax=Roseovarius roseus TaxID=3342636 RepID=UPI0037280F4A